MPEKETEKLEDLSDEEIKSLYYYFIKLLHTDDCSGCTGEKGCCG